MTNGNQTFFRCSSYLSRSNLAQRPDDEYEYMEMEMEGTWMADDLVYFADSVNTIYETYCILEMIEDKKIHEKVIAAAVNLVQSIKDVDSNRLALFPNGR